MINKSKLPKSLKINKAKEICRLYSSGEYKITACCKAVDVKYETFKQWAQPSLTKEDLELGRFRRGFVPVVHALYKEALSNNETNYKLLLKDAAREGILTRARGISYTETHRQSRFDKDGNSNGVVIIKIEKYLPPDPRILIFIANCLNLLFDNTDIEKLNANLKNPFHCMAYEDLKMIRMKLESGLL